MIIHPDNSITVTDNGRGIPVEMHKVGKPAIEVVMTVLHAGGKFGDGGYKVSAGSMAWGFPASMPEQKDGGGGQEERKIYGIEFSKGKTTRPLYVKGECPENETGTSVTFWPDDTIFTKRWYSYDT